MWCEDFWFVTIRAVVGEMSFSLAVVACCIFHVSGSASSGTIYVHGVGVCQWCRELSDWGGVSVVCMLGRGVPRCLLPVVISLVVVLCEGGASSFLVSLSNPPSSVDLYSLFDPVLTVGSSISIVCRCGVCSFQFHL